MTTVSIEEAKGKLLELIHALRPGDELVITENQKPVARLLPEAEHGRTPRRRGSARGKLTILSDDDDHLEDFKEYMP